MAYRRRHNQVALGGISTGEVVAAAAAVVSDPCLKPVASAMVRIHKARYGTSSGGVSSLPSGGGIGLCKIQKPLEAWAWMEERATWFPYVAGVGIVAGIFALGYWSGKGRRAT